MWNGALRIGEVAKRLGMNPRTIRFYEAAGLLPPPQRTEHGYASAGHRLFDTEDLRRLQFVRQARLLDLSLDEIRELVRAAEDGCCGVARPRLKILIQEKLPELRRRIADLRQLGGRLVALDRALPEGSRGSRESCDGTADRCIPLEDRPLLQISPPSGRGRQPTKR